MKNYIFRTLKFCLKAALGFFVISTLLVILLRWMPVYVTPLMVLRSIEQKMDDKEVKLEQSWKSIDEISPFLQLAVVCSEDQNFLNHHGLDYSAIRKALYHNKHNSNKLGASTISQQTAKNVFLWPSRSWVRKGFEVYFTFLIEAFWDKKRIMEVYLNVIEMGDGIYGAESASRFYYNKSAKELNIEEAATISSILPSPLTLDPQNPCEYLEKRKIWTMKQMNIISKKMYFDNQKEKQIQLKS